MFSKLLLLPYKFFRLFKTEIKYYFFYSIISQNLLIMPKEQNKRNSFKNKIYLLHFRLKFNNTKIWVFEVELSTTPGLGPADSRFSGRRRRERILRCRRRNSRTRTRSCRRENDRERGRRKSTRLQKSEGREQPFWDRKIKKYWNSVCIFAN